MEWKQTGINPEEWRRVSGSVTATISKVKKTYHAYVFAKGETWAKTRLRSVTTAQKWADKALEQIKH